MSSGPAPKRSKHVEFGGNRSMPLPDQTLERGLTAAAKTISVDQLRMTRPPRPKPATDDQSNGKPVEAWATPGKMSSKENSSSSRAATKVPADGSGRSGAGGNWAERRDLPGDTPTKGSTGGMMSMSVRSVDDTNGNTGKPKMKMTTLRKTNHNRTTSLPGSKTLQQQTAKQQPSLMATTQRDPEEKTRLAEVAQEGTPLDDLLLGGGQRAVALRSGCGGGGGGGGGGGNHGGGMARALSLPKLPLSAEEKRQNIPVGTLFERDSPRAKGNLRSFLRNFMEPSGVDIKTDIDLGKHSVATGQPISNAWIQEICVMQNGLKSLRLANGKEVTDIGLWAVARHCPDIEELDLSKCDAVSKIGLRSLSLKCTHLKSLKFDDCEHVDDGSLRTLAAGCWDLRKLSVRNCHQLTDAGLIEVAKCCTRLTELNVSGCRHLGEFGDRALVEIGKHCPDLKVLDMYGCEHVRDQGLSAIAHGCPHLDTLRLTGCKAVTGAAVTTLAKHCTGLTDLSLSGCQKVNNKDIAVLAKSCRKMTALDLSDCHSLGANGVQAVVSNCYHLKTMSLERCAKLGEDACMVLAHAHKLSYLSMGGCPAVTERGIGEIAEKCTGIESLNITGCNQISRRFVMEMIGRMEFAQPAKGWYGYEPKEDSLELRSAKAAYHAKMTAATEIQRQIRGYLGRRKGYDKYREWVVHNSLQYVQARVRGVFERRRWQKRRVGVLQQRGATAIAAAMRGFLVRKQVAKLKHGNGMDRAKELLSVVLQRTWRAYVDRSFVRVLRREAYARAVEAAKHQAVKELMARRVQKIWRQRQSRKTCDLLKAARDAREARAALELTSCVVMQRVLRGHLGRQVHRMVRREYWRRLQEWLQSVCIQAAFRGMGGRKRAAYLRWLAEKEHDIKMAIRVQTAWRSNRARYLAGMARSLRDLRNTEYFAARQIQRIVRGKFGRDKASRRKLLVAELRVREKSAMTMCRAYRGFKGRERWEVAFQLRRLEVMAKPLYLREAFLLDQKAKLEVEAEAAMEELMVGTRDRDELREELETMMTVTSKYWDSALLSGAPQRYLTEYLKIRLAEQLAELEAKIEEDKDKHNDLVVQVRQREREVRQVRRELQPLTQGMALKTRRDRVVRLRSRVRLEKKSSTTIQRLFRGHRLRNALFSWYRDYWTERVDESTGKKQFFNVWSEEVAWIMPLEMALLPHMNKAQDYEPEDEEDEEEEEEDDDEEEDGDDEDDEGDEDGGEIKEGGESEGGELAVLEGGSGDEDWQNETGGGAIEGGGEYADY